MTTNRTGEEKRRRGKKPKGAKRAITKADTPRAPEPLKPRGVSSGQRQGPETLGQNLKKRMSGKTLSPESIKENTFARQPGQKIDWSKGGGKGARAAAGRAANAGKAAARGMAGRAANIARAGARGLGRAAPALLGAETLVNAGEALGRGAAEWSTGKDAALGAGVEFSRNTLNALVPFAGLGDNYIAGTRRLHGLSPSNPATAETPDTPGRTRRSRFNNFVAPFEGGGTAAATPGANPAALGQVAGVRDRPGSAQTVNAALVGSLPKAAAQHTRGQIFQNKKTGQWKVFDGMEYADFDPKTETPKDVLAETEERWSLVRDRETGAEYLKSNRGITNIDGAYFGGIPQHAVRRGFDQAGLDKYRHGPVAMGNDEITMTMGKDGEPTFTNRKLGAAALGGDGGMDRSAVIRQRALERLDELLRSISYNADPGAYAEEMANLQNILTMTGQRERSKNDYIVIDGGLNKPSKVLDARTGLPVDLTGADQVVAGQVVVDDATGIFSINGQEIPREAARQLIASQRGG